MKNRTATPTEVTRPALVALAREGLSSVCEVFAGGTEIYFTEVNRAHTDMSDWDGLCFSITPQIHAFTDVDVVENLDAQGENVRSARVIAGGKHVIVSPITMRGASTSMPPATHRRRRPASCPTRSTPGSRRCTVPPGRQEA